MKKLKILIIDDDVELREIYSEIFQNAKFEVLQANDGVEGLDIATVQLPDVIFTGIIMPRMDGFTMMESLNKTVMTASIPVVVSSHMGNKEDQKRANLLGAKDFIVRGATSPLEVVERIKALFVQSGEEYKISFDHYALDAQKLAKDFGFQTNFQCLDCQEKMVLKLKLTDSQSRLFSAIFVCPKCGWVAK